MTTTNLDTTKQSKQIASLRNRLEKVAWKIIKEEGREFKGKPRWENQDDIPNLIYTWTIQRNPIVDPLEIDFIAHWDYMSNEIEINNCTHCIVRASDLILDFVKDRSLKNESNKQKWEEKMERFMENLKQ